MNLTPKIYPFLICLFLILLSQTPDLSIGFIPFVFIVIFYFALFRPSVLNGYMVFGLGLFTDLISQTPLGLYSFSFVLLFFVVTVCRLFLFSLTTKQLWVFFSVMAGITLLVELFLFVLATGTTVPAGFLVGQLLVLVLTYPLGMRLCRRLDKRIGVSG